MSFYGVHRGRKTGVFREWSQVQILVNGYQGAAYKKFKTHAQAQHFVETGEVKKANSQVVKDAFKDNGELHIYTDGAYSSKTKRSGVGVAWDAPYIRYAIAKRLPDRTTNQQAELDAIVSALRTIDTTPELQAVITDRKAVIWTDSDYACRCLADYIHRWRENGWVTSQKKAVKHKALILECDRLLTKLRHVKLRHISELGLSSHDSAASVKNAAPLTIRVWDGNRRADALAKGL
jgi:ribonuclease HI